MSIIDISGAKRMLYAMRNGIVADALRKGGCPRINIYGVNLPQLNEIAEEIGSNRDLALQMWEDGSLREFILLATMIYPPEQLEINEAKRLAHSVLWEEEADILCFKLLRKTAYASELAAELCSSDNQLVRYTGLRLWFNIVGQYPSEALAAAREELKRTNPVGLATSLAEEATFYLDT